MNLRRLAPFLLIIVLTMTACTPLDLFGMPRIPSHPSTLPTDSLVLDDPTTKDPHGGRSERDIAVFYTEHEPGYPDSETVLHAHHDKMSSVAGFWYQIDPVTYELRNAAGHPSYTIAQSKDTAEGYGLNTEMLVYNFLYPASGMSHNVLEQLMTNPATQTAFISNLRNQALRLGYSGVSIDFEHLRPAYRDEFSDLIDAIAASLRDYGLSSSISVGAKTWDNPTHGWSGGYDYGRLGAAVDRLILMTYDEHGFSSGPGPIASSPWVEQVIQYAISQVPANKLMLGIAGYGFDWNSAGGHPTYLSYEQAEHLRGVVGAQLRWDSVSNTPYFTYVDAVGNQHEVWYEDASSTSWKLDAIDRYDLRGLALWRLGLEDPALWDVIAEKFHPMR